MKRHSTRKMLTAHDRGEHAGYNVKYSFAGCPLCQEDLAKVLQAQDDHIAQVKKYIEDQS